MADLQTAPQRQEVDQPSVPPLVDVYEDAEGITLYADLPGVPKDALSVLVERDTLTIEGEVKLAAPENMSARHVEFSRPRYRRVFTLSRDLDTEKVSAEYGNGVLKLRIPKAQHAQPRRIDIQVV